MRRCGISIRDAKGGVWVKTHTDPDGFQVGNCSVTSDMTPSHGAVGVLIVPEHLAELVPDSHLNEGGHGARLKGDVVRVVQHRHEVTQEGRHCQVSAHVGFIARGPEGCRMLAKQTCNCLGGKAEILCNLDEAVRAPDILRYEPLIMKGVINRADVE